MEIFKEFTFEAAHFLPMVPEGHKCRSLHGHSYRCEVRVRGPMTAAGWVCDFADIKAAVEPVIRRLDHHCLNDIDGLTNPTSENLAVWLWQQIQPELPGLCRVTVSETDSSGCTYDGDDTTRSDGAVYLAGGINGLSDALCRDWREYVKSKIPNCLDPMRRDYRGREDQHVDDIVAGDYSDIRACRAVIANCVSPSWGTAMEIHFAWSKGKPVHAVVPQGTRVSPWLRYHCTAIHETLEAAIVAVQEIP